MVGLIPLFAVETLEPRACSRQLPGFTRRLEWFIAQPAGPDEATSRRMRRDGRRRAAAAVDRAARPAARVLHVHARRERVPLAARHPRALARSTATHPYVAARRRRRVPRRLRARRVDAAALFGGNSNWRGPVWFPVNYLLDRVAAEVPPLSRRRLHGRVPDRLGPDDDAAGGRGRAVAAAVAIFLRDDRRPARRCSAATSCSSSDPHWRDLHSVLRVLPRRHRRGPRREPPDRLDGAGRQAAAAERRTGTTLTSPRRPTRS